MHGHQPLDVDAVRAEFPALRRTDPSGHAAAYLDGPGGTQAPQAVIDAMAGALERGVSNLGGRFAPSREANEIVEGARAAMADFFNCRPGEVAFGQNMTSLTFALSRALAAEWSPGDAIVLTSLDHDANFAPWMLAARDRGVEVRVAEFDVATGALDPGAIGALLDDRVRLVAVCAAANSIGTVVDVRAVVELAHSVGARVFVDAVHVGPHRSIDVQSLGCDFLVASSYKFFGPHTGILFGREELLASVTAYKLRPAPSDPPGKWETGTQSFESLAGVTAAVDYIASLGGEQPDRRAGLVEAFARIGRHEQTLIDRFQAGVSSLPEIEVFGSRSPAVDRVATFALRRSAASVAALAGQLVKAGLYVWSGDYYAVNVMDRFGLAESGGLVRIGFVHYNTEAEVDRVLEVLQG
jgi:cysteine desulfurase family protein (TIGR01976 family)